MEKTFVNGAIKDCCRVAANLEPVPEESKSGLDVKKCLVCGCRHRRLVLEPGMLGLKFEIRPKERP